MSRANGQTSEVVASFLFEEVLTDPEKAAIQDLIGVSPSGDVDAVVAEVAKRILYDPALDNVVGTDPDSLRTVATVDLPTNSIHAINLGSQLDFYRLRVGAPTGPSPEQVLPLDYATSGKYWKLHAVPRLPLVLSGVPEDGAFAIKAIGTVNFNNVPVDGDELIIDDRAYVWRDSPAISGDIPIGIDADASSVNLTTIIDDGDALNIPHATVSVYLPLAVTGTVLLQFNVAGTVGNSTPLSGDSVDLQYIPFNGGTEAVTGTPAEYIGQNAIFGSRNWFCSDLEPFAWVELTQDISGKANLAGGNTFTEEQSVVDVLSIGTTDSSQTKFTVDTAGLIMQRWQLNDPQPDSHVRLSNGFGSGFGWDQRNLDLTANRVYQMPDLDGTIPSVPSYPDLTEANVSLDAGDFFWDTTLKKLRVATA